MVAPPGTPAEDVLGVAADLTAEALALAAPGGIETIFARPQSLDRVWVRTGFIPVPEAELPRPLRGRPGLGSSVAGRHRALEHRRSRRLPLRPRPRRTLTGGAAA